MQLVFASAAVALAFLRAVRPIVLKLLETRFRTEADAVEGVEGEEVNATPDYVRVSAEDYARLRRRLEKSHPILEMVGWFHSHPTLPPQLSLDDRQEQLTWTDMNHVALVVSCGSSGARFGVYHGPNSIQMFRRND